MSKKRHRPVEAAAAVSNRPTQANKYGTRYPWDAWFSLEEFILRRGKDYQSRSYVMAQMLRNAARSRGLSLSIEISTTEDVMVVKVL